MYTLGIAGAAGSGKSTAADLIASEVTQRLPGINVQVRPLAGALHSMAASILGSTEYQHNRAVKEGPVEITFPDNAEMSILDTLANAIMRGAPQMAEDTAHVMALELCRQYEYKGSWVRHPAGQSVVTSPRELLQLLGTECGRALFGKYFWLDLLLADESADVIIVPDVRFLNEFYELDICIGLERTGCTTGTHASELDTPKILAQADKVLTNDGTKDDLVLALSPVLGVVCNLWFPNGVK